MLLWLLPALPALATASQLLSDCLFLQGKGQCNDLLTGYTLPGRLDVAFRLCPGSHVQLAQNDFPVPLKSLGSPRLRFPLAIKYICIGRKDGEKKRS